MDQHNAPKNDKRETDKQAKAETRLTVEVPTEISAGAEPVCRMCCNGPHSPPPR
jgi:hypothetical protein